jgi:hypothetical protein
MPGFLVHANANGICPHAGQISVQVAQSRVKVSNQPVATMSDTFSIANCNFTLPNGAKHPCTTVKWTQAALRVKVCGDPVVLQDSIGLCLAADQAPQGKPEITSVQSRVTGK